MNMQFTEIFTKFLLLLRANVFKVLVPKDNDTTLSNQQGKLIFLRISETGELQSAYLSADTRCQFVYNHIRVPSLEKI